MLSTLYVVILVSSTSYGGFAIESVSSWSTDLATTEACHNAGLRILEQKTVRLGSRTVHCIDKQTGDVQTFDKASGTFK